MKHHNIAGSLLALVCAGSACASDAVTAPHGLPGAVPIALVGPKSITVPTYDGSGQAVEPDVLYFPHRWHGWEYWMAMAPYPGGDAHFENPSILVSRDGATWEVPAGVANPVVLPPANGINSDPAVLYDSARDRLVLSYREVSNGLNLIKDVVSANGTKWGPPHTLFQVQQHDAVGQALTILDPSHPIAWYVNSGVAGCAARHTRVERRTGNDPAALEPATAGSGWSAPVSVALVQPGFVIWHLAVQYVPAKHEYWAVYAAYLPGTGCSRCDLFFARSLDGNVWTTYKTPLLRTGFSAWSAASLYRATFVYFPASDQLSVWFSARSAAGRWTLAFAQYRYADVIATLSR